jgi:Glyoxalase-like domain
MNADVRWMTAMLDSPPEVGAASEAFWLGVTGARLSPSRGQRHEFASLLTSDGDATLKVQRVVQSSPGAMHLDLHTDDVPGAAERVERLGGSTSYHVLGHVICGSPGGLSFCVVGHPGRRIPPPVAWPGGRSLVDQVCLDIPPHAYDDEVAFWRALTGWELVDAGGREFQRLRRPVGVPLALLLQRLDDSQPTTTAHLDLSCDDREAETGRHLALGAELVDVRPGWTVLRDPAGRNYCITGRRPGDV